jgi:hypothetical protein
VVAQSLLECRREMRRIRFALGEEGAPEDGAAAEKLRKQLEVLQREEKELVVQTRVLNSSSSEVSTLNIQIEAQEQLLRRLTVQLFALTSEQDAPARVELLEPATARGGSKTRSAAR